MSEEPTSACAPGWKLGRGEDSVLRPAGLDWLLHVCVVCTHPHACMCGTVFSHLASGQSHGDITPCEMSTLRLEVHEWLGSGCPVRLVCRFGETPLSWPMFSRAPAQWVRSFLCVWKPGRSGKPRAGMQLGIGLLPGVRQVLGRHGFVPWSFPETRLEEEEHRDRNPRAEWTYFEKKPVSPRAACVYGCVYEQHLPRAQRESGQPAQTLPLVASALLTETRRFLHFVFL